MALLAAHEYSSITGNERTLYRSKLHLVLVWICCFSIQFCRLNIKLRNCFLIQNSLHSFKILSYICHIKSDEIKWLMAQMHDIRVEA